MKPHSFNLIATSFALLVFAVSCATIHRVYKDPKTGQMYDDTSRKIFGVPITHTTEPVKSESREARDDTRALFRKLAMFSAAGAVAMLVIGYLTKYGSATAVAGILGGSCLVFAWLSMALKLVYVVGCGAVFLVLVVVAVHLQEFDLFDWLKAKLGRSDNAGKN